MLLFFCLVQFLYEQLFMTFTSSSAACLTLFVKFKAHAIFIIKHMYGMLGDIKANRNNFCWSN